MAYERMVIDRHAVEAELNRVFDPSITQVVVGVLNQVAISAVDATRPDLHALRETVHELAQAQLRTEARLEELAQAQARTEARLAELVQAQARTEARLERLEAVMEELVQVQLRAEARLERLEATVGSLKGWALEDRYRHRAGAYFGQLLRRLCVVPVDDLEETLETRLTDDELAYLRRIDLLLRGRLAHGPDAEPIWLAVEISAKVDEHDVARAQQRAALLRRAGYRAVPLVAGEDITPDARSLAAMQHVPLALDGKIRFWDEALADVLAD
jgi:hypothetical protein